MRRVYINNTHNKCAPTGSVSLLTQTTSGVEPLFMPFYMRRKKVNPGEDIRVDFVDQNNDSWQEFPVLHQKFKEWINNRTDLLYNIDDENPNITVEELSKGQLEYLFEESPWHNSIANDIDWIKRNEIQAILQKYTTNAISSTINLPEDVSVEEVSKIYMDGWKRGLKGQTVYRDGSRSGVLVDTSKEVKEDKGFDYADSFKRPKSLRADVHNVTSKGEKYSVIIGLVDDKPYEVFVMKDQTSIEEGLITKKKKGVYVLEGKKGESTITQTLSLNTTDEEDALTRMISMSLRHRVHIKYVVEQLNSSNGTIVSFSKAIARVLKKYIKDGEKSTVTCNECGSKNTIFEEGCSRCLGCGSSKCG